MGERRPQQARTRAGLAEAHIEQLLLMRATQRGWKAHHVTDSRRVLMGDTGAPDWWLARWGKLVVVELKREDGKLSPEQREWLDAMGWLGEQDQWDQLLGFPRLTVWVIRPSSLNRFLEVLE